MTENKRVYWTTERTYKSMTLLKRDQEEGLITVNNQKKREREEGKSREGG